MQTTQPRDLGALALIVGVFLVLLVISILICTIDRTPRLWRTASEIRVVQPDPYFDPKLNDVPVDFLSTVDTTGGNSGSATLNAKGELVGLLFDGTFDTVASDYLFDPVRTRSIHVDVRYMLWVMTEVEAALRSDSGEAITLKDATNGTLSAFTYSDGRGWPLAADGAGHSLAVDHFVACLKQGVQPEASGEQGLSHDFFTALGLFTMTAARNAAR